MTKKIDALVDEAMSQAQVFASAWSLVGGIFDHGNALENAEVEKKALRALIADLLSASIADTASLSEAQIDWIVQSGRAFSYDEIRAKIGGVREASIADTAPVFRCNDCGGFDIEQVPETMKPESIAPQAECAPREAQPVALTDAQIEAGWRQTFSTDNPYCPCNLQSFTKSVRWVERAKEKK
jgi:hypothetical protein